MKCLFLLAPSSLPPLYQPPFRLGQSTGNLPAIFRQSTGNLPTVVAHLPENKCPRPLIQTYELPSVAPTDLFLRIRNASVYNPIDCNIREREAPI